MFVDLRDTCRKQGVLWMIRDTVYDPASYEDMLTPGVLSLVAEARSDIKAKNIPRGIASSARQGRPHSRTLFGYVREYHPQTRVLVAQHPKDGEADVAREIILRAGAGEPASAIASDLNRRGLQPSGTIIRLTSKGRRGWTTSRDPGAVCRSTGTVPWRTQ